MVMNSFHVRSKFLNLARWGCSLTVDLEPGEAIARSYQTNHTFQKKKAVNCHLKVKYEIG